MKAAALDGCWFTDASAARGWHAATRHIRQVAVGTGEASGMIDGIVSAFTRSSCHADGWSTQARVVTCTTCMQDWC